MPGRNPPQGFDDASRESAVTAPIVPGSAVDQEATHCPERSTTRRDGLVYHFLTHERHTRRHTHLCRRRHRRRCVDCRGAGRERFASRGRLRFLERRLAASSRGGGVVGLARPSASVAMGRGRDGTDPAHSFRGIDGPHRAACVRGVRVAVSGGRRVVRPVHRRVHRRFLGGGLASDNRSFGVRSESPWLNPSRSSVTSSHDVARRSGGPSPISIPRRRRRVSRRLRGWS